MSLALVMPVFSLLVPPLGLSVVQSAVVTFRPKMFVGSDADQLHVDVHGVGNFLNATFEQIGDAKLFPDLAQIVRRPFVFLRRITRHNFKS